MSVRAHRVVKVEYAPSPSFNLYFDQKLINYLDDHGEGFWRLLNDDGVGQVYIEVDTLKAALRRPKKLALEPDAIEAIKADIAFAESQGDDGVTYDCF